MSRPIRSIFISDVHLGCKYANAEALLAFLKGQQPEFLYIVGDFIDGWRLKRSWYWNDTYSFLIRRVLKMMKRGTQVFYTPGNHDEFLRRFLSTLGSVRITDEVIHVTADRRRLLVLHGDQFDVVVRHARWLSLLGDYGYDGLLVLNRIYNSWRRRLGFGYWSLSAFVKQRVKQATTFVSNFEDVATKYAASKGCQGVVCGHIHTPAHRERNGIAYYNTGDWMENCTALVEYQDGTFEVIHRPAHLGAQPAVPFTEIAAEFAEEIHTLLEPPLPGEPAERPIAQVV
jgi:UDP-2,3-diacylglucosamine pyrophosphatase LpxH